jgi:hypothetical protein
MVLLEAPSAKSVRTSNSCEDSPAAAKFKELWSEATPLVAEPGGTCRRDHLDHEGPVEGRGNV